MDFEQIQAAAEADSPYLNDRSYVRILVASLNADQRAATIRDAFQNTPDKGGWRAKVVNTGSFGLYDLEPMVVIEAPDSCCFINRSYPFTSASRKSSKPLT